MKGVQDIQQRRAQGTHERDGEGMGPTGPTYRAREEKQQQQQQALKAAQETENLHNLERLEILKQQHSQLESDARNGDTNDNACASDSSDDEYDHLLEELEEDPTIVALRQQRLNVLRHQQTQRADWLAKGHGQYRIITQDEFLTECTGSSPWVVVHFAHDEFERCKIMDHHLRIIATQHLECKFLKILAPKAPFFVNKLAVKTLPTLLIFRDGKVADRLTGFDGLAPDAVNKPDEWETSRLQLWLSELKGGEAAIQYTPPSDEVLKEMKRLGLQHRGTIYSEANTYDEYDS
jgi:thiol-disulfide isomerase/thioredoxin